MVRRQPAYHSTEVRLEELREVEYYKGSVNAQDHVKCIHMAEIIMLFAFIKTFLEKNMPTYTKYLWPAKSEILSGSLHKYFQFLD